jgi:hypothetical protein
MAKTAQRARRVLLTRSLSIAWSLVYTGRDVVRLAEWLEGMHAEQLRSHLAWRLMTDGEDMSAHEGTLGYSVDRWARALGVPHGRCGATARATTSRGSLIRGTRGPRGSCGVRVLLHQ